MASPQRAAACSGRLTGIAPPACALLVAAALLTSSPACDTPREAGDGPSARARSERAEQLVVLRPDGATTAPASVEVRGDTVTVTASGTYRVQGWLRDGMLVVDSDDPAPVRLILDGAALSNESGPALWAKHAEAVAVELAAGTESRLRDGARYAPSHPASGPPSAALFSSVDLTIGGSGTLVVEGRYNDGICSKRRLAVESGTLVVSAFDDGIRGKEALAVSGGEVSVDAGDDGLKADGAADAGAGNVSIDAGSVRVDAADDAIHATGMVAIQGGTLRLRGGDDAVHADTGLTIAGGELAVEASYEGLDSAAVSIAGGTIALTSLDDGINVAGRGRRGRHGRWEPGRLPQRARAARGGRRPRRLVISGGSIVIDATGDGIDSNHPTEITGGTILVYGPTVDFDGALDVDGSFTLSGGSLVAGGSAAVAEAPTASAQQPVVVLTFPTPVAAGSTVRLTAADGTELVSYRSARPVQSLVVSTPAMRPGSPLGVALDGTSIGTVTPLPSESGESAARPPGNAEPARDLAGAPN